MSNIYSFLLHFAALVFSFFPPASTSAIRYASTKTQRYRTVQATMRAPESGYWHTTGNLILDEQNRPIRIRGISWYGFETVRQVPGGLTRRDYREILRTIRANGFNTVRIPFSNQMVENPMVPGAISFRNDRGPINSDLQGLTSLQIMDRIVQAAGEVGLRVILDNHRSEAGDSAEASGLWYTADYPERKWIVDWQRLVQRYEGNSTVIGVDLRNEPHNASSSGACWDCGGDRDWHLAAERAGDAVLRVNRRLIVFVEGVDAYNNDFFWWGGNLEGVRRSPVRLEIEGQLVYSAHSYGPREYRQKWFAPSATMTSLEAVEYRHWAYVSLEGIAPVWLGEFGTTNDTDEIRGFEAGSEGQWFQAMVDLLERNPELNWSLWALNGEDGYGLLDANYDLTPANPVKIELLAHLESPATVSRQPEVQVARQFALSPMRPYTSLTSQWAGYTSPRWPNYSGSAACHVSYRNENDTGYSADDVVEIENLSGQAIDGWTLLWMYDGTQEIQHARGARFVQNGDTVGLTNTRSEGVIPAGGAAEIVLETSYRGSNKRPAKFYLNGSLCS